MSTLSCMTLNRVFNLSKHRILICQVYTIRLFHSKDYGGYFTIESWMQNAHSAQCLALNKCRIYSFIQEIFNEYVTWGRQCSRGWDAVQIPASMLLPIYCPLLTCHRLQMVMTAVENVKAGEGGIGMKLITVPSLLKDGHGSCADNTTVLSELGGLSDNCLSDSGILPVKPEGRGSVLRRMFLQFYSSDFVLFWWWLGDVWGERNPGEVREWTIWRNKPWQRPRGRSLSGVFADQQRGQCCRKRLSMEKTRRSWDMGGKGISDWVGLWGLAFMLSKSESCWRSLGRRVTCSDLHSPWASLVAMCRRDWRGARAETEAGVKRLPQSQRWELVVASTRQGQ